MRNEKSNSGCGCFPLIIFFFIAMACIIIFESGEESSKEYEEQPHVVTEGQNGYLTDTIFIAVDEVSYKEMMGYVVENNIDALERMMWEGELSSGDKGQEVTILKFGYTRSLIEVVESGLRGYVPTEKVKSKVIE
jgi:hypothetical protein